MAQPQFYSVCIYLIGKSISLMVACTAEVAAGVMMLLCLLISLFVYGMAAPNPISAIQKMTVRYGQVQNGSKISEYRFET